MKKLIKRLEEQAVENERLCTENSELKKKLRKHEPRVTGYEWFGSDIKDDKIKGRLTYEGEDLLQGVKDKVFNELDKEQAESIVSDILVDEIKKRLFEQMNDTGVTKDTSCFDGLLSKMQDSQAKTKELEEAIKYLNGYAKGAYPIKPKLKKAIETILKHLDNENKK